MRSAKKNSRLRALRVEYSKTRHLLRSDLSFAYTQTFKSSTGVEFPNEREEPPWIFVEGRLG